MSPDRRKRLRNLPGIVKTMLKYMLDTSDKDRAFLSVNKSDETVLLVNNLGGVSVLELGGITNEVVNQLSSNYGIKPVRILAGTFMTSLNGLGFSVSLLKVQDTGVGKSMLELLDAPAECSGWSAAITSKTWANPPSKSRERNTGPGTDNKPCGLEIDPTQASKALKHALAKLIKAEPDITKYDTVVGDGDCGIGLKAWRRRHFGAPVRLAGSEGCSAVRRQDHGHCGEHHGRHVRRAVRHLPQRTRARSADAEHQR